MQSRRKTQTTIESRSRSTPGRDTKRPDCMSRHAAVQQTAALMVCSVNNRNSAAVAVAVAAEHHAGADVDVGNIENDSTSERATQCCDVMMTMTMAESAGDRAR